MVHKREEERARKRTEGERLHSRKDRTTFMDSVIVWVAVFSVQTQLFFMGIRLFPLCGVAARFSAYCGCQ